MKTTFNGYRRSDGTVGVRNYLAVVPSVFCSNRTVERITAQLPGAICLRHAVGCSQVGLDLELTARTLKAMGTHPNVGAVIVVGLGCERFNPRELFEAVQNSGRPVELFVIQEEGGTTNTINKAVEAGRKMLADLAQMRREPCSVSELMVATKCGGTDATSGLAANPVVGEMSDLLNALGGSTILSECNELLGTEDILARRAVNEEVAKKIYDAIYDIEDVLRSGLDNTLDAKRNQLISPGNFDGGVSSIVEKALGGMHKSGTAKIVDVIDYAVRPSEGKHGLFLMKYESHDAEVVTGMLGCGAQLAAFTTGRGTPAGHPIAPIIKVTGNSKTWNKMKENFDFDASGVISADRTIKDLGLELFEFILRVANGEETSAEKIGGDELFCIARRHGYRRKSPEEVAELSCQY